MRRVFIIGLDAADPDLVHRWMREGQLPALSSLMKRSLSGRLTSPAWMSTGPVWPSFFAGTSPARHGRFFFRQLESGTYRIVKKRADEIEATPFWKRLSRAGKAVAVLDVPKTFPLRDCVATQIIGWGVHSAAWETSSHPQSLLADIRRLFGHHPVPNCDEVRLATSDDYEAFVEGLLSGISRKCELAEWLYSHQGWDLFIAVFSETHCGGHRLWHIHDPDHPDHDPLLRQRLGDPLLRVYQRLDAVIGRLVQIARDSTVVVFSPHGMGPNYGGSHLLPGILERLGMGSSPEPGAARNPGPQLRMAGLTEGILTRMPLWLQKALRALVPARTWDDVTTRFLSFGRRWAESRVFCVPGDYAGAIRVNLAGREPRGQVKPGDEYDALCAELARGLSSLENPMTGKRVVRKVTRIDKVYKGDRIDQLPDLIVQWAGDAPVFAVSSPRIGTVVGTEKSRRSGEDRSDGFLIIAGPDILRGGGMDECIGDLTDLAPTITALIGEPVNGDFDGRILPVIALGESLNQSNPD